MKAELNAIVKSKRVHFNGWFFLALEAAKQVGYTVNPLIGLGVFVLGNAAFKLYDMKKEAKFKDSLLVS